jgi:hypothetical protein
MTVEIRLRAVRRRADEAIEAALREDIGSEEFRRHVRHAQIAIATLARIRQEDKRRMRLALALAGGDKFATE